jgi:hypothetical protein
VSSAPEFSALVPIDNRRVNTLQVARCHFSYCPTTITTPSPTPHRSILCRLRGRPLPLDAKHRFAMGGEGDQSGELHERLIDQTLS